MKAIAAWLVILASARSLPADEASRDGWLDLVTMGRAVSVSVGVPTAFEQYRDVPEGFTIPSLVVEAGSRSLLFFRLSAADAGQRDQSVGVRIGVAGRWKGLVEFDEFPFLRSAWITPLHTYRGAGRLVVPDAVQHQLEFATDAEFPAAAHAVVRELRREQLRTQRNRIRGRFSALLTDRWSVRLVVRDEMRDGRRPYSIGAFERTPSGFAILGFELPVPVEIRTNEVTAGTSFHAERYGVDMDATYSRFRNTITDLTFDNPFRIDDAAATAGGDRDRLRSSLGISTDFPDSLLVSAFLTGYFDVGERLRLASSIGWTRLRQYQRFAPYTLNSAVVAPDFPPGLSPVNTEALPSSSLNGRVSSMSIDDSLVYRMTEKAILRVAYSDLDTSDKTPSIAFPGYVGSGDGEWRREFLGRAVRRDPLSMRDQQAAVDFDWKPAKALHVQTDYDHVHRSRAGWSGGATDENAWTSRVAMRLRNGHSGSIAYTWSDRQPSDPLPAPTAFELACRRRSILRGQWEYTPRGQKTFSVVTSFSAMRDRYAQTSVLGRFQRMNGTIDLHWLLSSATLSAAITRQTLEHSQEWSEIPDSNTWRRNTDDGVTDLALSFFETLRDDRLSLALRAVGSLARQTVRTRAMTSGEMPIRDWPAVRNRLTDFSADFQYTVNDRLKVGAQYLFEAYTVDDFGWAHLSPYPVAALSDDTDARRLFFLDSRASDHDAHMLGFYVRSRF